MSPNHPAITAYLDALRAADKERTATTNAGYLAKFQGWLATQGVDVLHATADVLARYQLWLANAYRTVRGEPLALTTQATAISLVKALYRWLLRRGIILLDPAAKLVPPNPPERLAVGKPPDGLLRVTARRERGDVVIEVADASALGELLDASAYSAYLGSL